MNWIRFERFSTSLVLLHIEAVKISLVSTPASYVLAIREEKVTTKPQVQEADPGRATGTEPTYEKSV